MLYIFNGYMYLYVNIHILKKIGSDVSLSHSNANFWENKGEVGLALEVTRDCRRLVIF